MGKNVEYIEKYVLSGRRRIIIQNRTLSVLYSFGHVSKNN